VRGWRGRGNKYTHRTQCIKVRQQQWFTSTCPPAALCDALLSNQPTGWGALKYGGSEISSHLWLPQCWTLVGFSLGRVRRQKIWYDKKRVQSRMRFAGGTPAASAPKANPLPESRPLQMPQPTLAPGPEPRPAGGRVALDEDEEDGIAAAWTAHKSDNGQVPPPPPAIGTGDWNHGFCPFQTTTVHLKIIAT